MVVSEGSVMGFGLLWALFAAGDIALGVELDADGFCPGELGYWVLVLGWFCRFGRFVGFEVGRCWIMGFHGFKGSMLGLDVHYA